MVGYQVDEFSCTWSTEQFVAHSHVPLVFTGKVLSLNHFPLEPGYEDCSILDQAVAYFEQGLDSFLADSIETLEIDRSFDEPEVITCSACSGFLCLVSTGSDTSELPLALGIRYHKLWCQVRSLLLPLSLATKIPTSKLIQYFLSQAAAFWSLSSSRAGTITLNPANRKAY